MRPVYSRRGRLCLSILVTALELSALAIVALWLLPRFGIRIPLPLVVGLGILWIGWEVFSYTRGTRALEKPLLSGGEALVGRIAKTINHLNPDGLVRLDSEVWQARSEEGDIDAGEEVTVRAKEGLRLLVKRKGR